MILNSTFAFRSRSVQDTQKLGGALAIVLDELFNRKAKDGNSDEIQSFTVGLKGLPDSGKSIFAFAALRGLAEKNSYILTNSPFDGEFWRMAHSFSAGVQHLTYDHVWCLCNSDLVYIPERLCPGLDIIEHPPKEKADSTICTVQFERQADASRSVEISFDKTLLSEPARTAFLSLTQDLQLNA